MHGEMEKMARANILNDFRRGRLRALVVSDVVARGLDVSECDAVFHAELPSSAAHYAHRAGRTGRMDAPGTVVSIVTPQEVFVMDKLSKNLGVPILVRCCHHFNQGCLSDPLPSMAYDAVPSSTLIHAHQDGPIYRSLLPLIDRRVMYQGVRSSWALPQLH